MATGTANPGATTMNNAPDDYGLWGPVVLNSVIFVGPPLWWERGLFWLCRAGLAALGLWTAVGLASR